MRISRRSGVGAVARPLSALLQAVCSLLLLLAGPLSAPAGVTVAVGSVATLVGAVSAAPAEAQDAPAKAALARLLRQPTPIELVLVGQSNEHGNDPVSDATVWPQAFRSLRNPSDVHAPLDPAVTMTGGWLYKFYDDLYDYGYDTRIANGAIGSMSMVVHAAGFSHSWSASTAFYARRTGSTQGDPGYAGDLISPDGGGSSWWICVDGNVLGAAGSGPRTMSAGGLGAVYADAINSTGKITPGNSPALVQVTTAATKPSFPTTPAITQVVDGGLTWQLLSSGGDARFAGLTVNQVLTEQQAGVGFDPLGILQRAHDAGQRIRGVKKRYVLIQNGQGDVGNGTALYQAALTSVANFFLKRGYDGVIIGFTNYSPGTAGTIAQWQQLQTGKNNAITALQTANPGKVFAGADLFALMGQTGAQMGGARITGGISGSTLTISATAQGLVEVGQNIWNGNTLVGVVASGSGTSFQLTGAVTTTAGTSLVAAGTYFQPDGIHFNGAGYIAAGALEAAAVKTILGKPGFGVIGFATDPPRTANDNTAERLAA